MNCDRNIARMAVQMVCATNESHINLGDMNEILLEYYAGRSKELIKCEGYLDEIVKLLKEYDANRKSGISGLAKQNAVTNDCEWNVKLEKELANFFRVKKVNIFWKSGMVNAMTLTPFSFMIPQYKSNLKNGKTSNFTIDIMVYEELVTMANLTGAELMGVLLHEIGHNFYYCPVLIGLDVFNTVSCLGLNLVVGLLAKGIYTAINYLEDIIKKHVPLLYNAVTGFNDVMSDIKMIINDYTIVSTLSGLMSGRLVLRDPANPISALAGYGNEEGADSFAARYGYGAEQASALKKMYICENTLHGKAVKEGTVTPIMFDISTTTYEILGMFVLEPHPSNNQRAATMLKKLKRDLQTGDYPPEMKKDLEKQIAVMEETYKNINDNSSKSPQIRKQYYDILNAIFKDNSDFRELFSFYFKSFQF